MRAGAVIGYRGMIREILSSISGELDGIPSVVATGGDAALIVGGLPEIEEVVPDLTLRGIDLIGRRHLST
jgi:type III pantothenate kinase